MNAATEHVKPMPPETRDEKRLWNLTDVQRPRVIHVGGWAYDLFYRHKPPLQMSLRSLPALRKPTG
jgi:hypothetical protein